jgi:type I restriction enzyme M protein
VLQLDLKSSVDRLWDAFWANGIANPLEVVEQLSYLLFVRWLDHVQGLEEREAQATGRPILNPLYMDSDQRVRWSTYTVLAPQNMLETVHQDVFPWLRRFERPDIVF